MEFTILLGLLGLGLAGSFMGSDEGNDISVEDEPPPHTDERPINQPEFAATPDDAPAAARLIGGIQVPTATGDTLGSAGSDRIDNGGNRFSPLDEVGRYFDLQEGSDRITAGSGSDTIVAGDGFKTILSGAGDDLILLEGDGAHRIDGGEGDDTIAASGRITDTEGANLIVAGENGTLMQISGESTIISGPQADTIGLWFRSDGDTAGVITDFQGDEGDIFTRTFVELQPSDEGTVEARETEDGTGIELYFGDSLLMAAEGATLDDFEGTDILLRTNGGTYTASDGDDIIAASDAADTITGGAGNDYISGGLNRDTGPDDLNGGEGNDTILASGARDTEYYDPEDTDAPNSRVLEPNIMNGGSGDDTLITTYNNTMTGGDGQDTFGVQNWSGQTGVPLITDYNPEEDVIYVDYSEPLGPDENGVPVGDFQIVVWSDGTGADVMKSGQIIVRVAGGQTLTPADIIITDGSIGRDLLGWH